MHELSIAQNILDIVRQSVPEEELGAVRAVRLKVGTFSGVVADSLEFCFSAIVAETPLSRAALSIQHTPFRLRCRACNSEFTNEIGFVVCPSCGGPDTEIISGRELQITEIELEDREEGSP